MVYKVCGHFYTVQNLESKSVTQSKATLEFKDAAIDPITTGKPYWMYITN